MSQLPRYESYKDSGVQWLGEIPSHWNVKQLKFAVTCNDESLGENTELDYEILYVDISSVSLTDGIKHKEELLFENAPSRARRVVKSGDVLVSTVRTYLKAITYVESAEENLIASTGFAVLRPSEKFDSKFIGYWIQSEGMVGNIVANSVGVSYPAINSTDLVRLPIVELPLSEQKIIADFLDKRLTQVDALIAKQETLLEKLAEQRVALISHAVTKGLNPDADFIISKNAWLGEIPKDWILKPTKYFLSYVGSGKTPKGGAEVYIDEGVIMIRSQNIHDEGLRLEDVVHITDEADQGQINTRVYEDDVLLNITGASLGRVSLVPKGIPLANVNQHVCILRPIKSLILPQFLHLIMQSHYAKSLIKSEENGTSREGLTFEQIKAMVFALPPIDEQQTICEKIQSDLDDLNKSKNYCENLIKKLKEYRSTVITQVVTGKIDVRNLKVN